MSYNKLLILITGKEYYENYVERGRIYGKILRRYLSSGHF